MAESHHTVEPTPTHKEYSVLTDNVQQDEEIINIQNQLIHHIGNLKDSHHQDDIKWFQKLIHNNQHDIKTEDIDLGILYNFTFLDSIVAKLLNIDLRKIITIEITKRYIKELWEDNKQQSDFLDSHVLNNPQHRNFIEKTLRPSNTYDSERAASHHNNLIIEAQQIQHQTNTLQQTNHHQIEITTEIPEIDMTNPLDSDEENPTLNSEMKTSPKTNLSNIQTNETEGHDIREIIHFETRDRQYHQNNPYNLVKKGRYLAGALIANTPGNNKHEQINYLANLLKLPKENAHLIQTTFSNGNGWYTIYFKFEFDMDSCLNKINKKDEDFRFITINNPDNNPKLNTNKEIKPLHPIQPKSIKSDLKGKNREDLTDRPNNIHYTSPTESQDKQEENDKNEELDFNNPEEYKNIQVVILDIPTDFSYNRIKGSIQRYGQISNIRLENGNYNFKTVHVTFNSINLNLNKTWAIPMGDTMARILPLSNYIDTLIQRNQVTTRLYGIRKDTVASRIMSAIKHLNAKTVHIPKNSRTGKRRSFAIIGFENESDLKKALSSHVELFGCKTWWSTKDNSSLSKKWNGKNKTRDEIHSDEEYEEYSESKTDNGESSSNFININSSEITTPFKINNNSKKHYQPSKRRSNKSSQNIDQMPWKSIMLTLQSISTRLDKIESNDRSNNGRFRAHPRS
jgi:hypothetical protein